MTQEALNIAGQCRATASSPLAKNILVDEGNGLLTELLLDAARIIEALAQPEQEPVIDKSAAIRIATSLGWEPKRPWVGAGDLEDSNSYLDTPPQRTEQEPVAWGNFKEDGTLVGLSQHPEDQANWAGRKPLYTAPPQRTWVGLTGLEQKELMAMTARDAVFATEAKLKEKNGV